MFRLNINPLAEISIQNQHEKYSLKIVFFLFSERNMKLYTTKTFISRDNISFSYWNTLSNIIKFSL